MDCRVPAAERGHAEPSSLGHGLEIAFVIVNDSFGVFRCLAFVSSDIFMPNTTNLRRSGLSLSHLITKLVRPRRARFETISH